MVSAFQIVPVDNSICSHKRTLYIYINILQRSNLIRQKFDLQQFNLRVHGKSSKPKYLWRRGLNGFSYTKQMIAFCLGPTGTIGGSIIDVSLKLFHISICGCMCKNIELKMKIQYIVITYVFLFRAWRLGWETIHSWYGVISGSRPNGCLSKSRFRNLLKAVGFTNIEICSNKVRHPRN